jgi:hypothetical protein
MPGVVAAVVTEFGPQRRTIAQAHWSPMLTKPDGSPSFVAYSEAIPAPCVSSDGRWSLRSAGGIQASRKRRYRKMRCSFQFQRGRASTLPDIKPRKTENPKFQFQETRCTSRVQENRCLRFSSVWSVIENLQVACSQYGSSVRLPSPPSAYACRRRATAGCAHCLEIYSTLIC